MISNHNVLRFLCMNTMIFLCHGICCDVYAGPTSGISATLVEGTGQSIDYNNSVVREHLESSAMAARGASAVSTISICPRGQYVAACGNYNVGFNWLKSSTLPDPNQSSGSRIQYKETRNYYISDDALDLFQQMRIFFGHENSSIGYLDGTNILYTADFQDDRETILNNLCHPSNSTVKCLSCPNNADVVESSVQLDSNNLTISGSWDFYTFADCYMQEFEDTTGTYFYVPDSVSFSGAVLDNAEICYYTNTNPEAISVLNGDEIGTFVPGLNNARTRTEIPGTIPTAFENR